MDFDQRDIRAPGDSIVILQEAAKDSNNISEVRDDDEMVIGDIMTGKATIADINRKFIERIESRKQSQ